MQDVIRRGIQSIGGASRQALINYFLLLSGVYINNIVNVFDTLALSQDIPCE